MNIKTPLCQTLLLAGILLLLSCGSATQQKNDKAAEGKRSDTTYTIESISVVKSPNDTVPFPPIPPPPKLPRAARKK